MLTYLFPEIFKSTKFWTLFIFAIAFVVRIHGGSELFFWNIDEDRFALTAKRILVDHRPVLIGYSLPKDIYLGPIFPYILSIWYAIARMNPFVLPIIASLITAATSVLVYYVGKTIFESKKIGVYASLLYAFSALSIVYSKVLTELTIAPILALFTYFIIYQNLKYRKSVNLIWLGLVLVLALQNEGSSFSLLVLVGVSWLIYRFKTPLKKLAIFISMLVISNITLLIFDLRHEFFITKAFLNFFKGGPSNVSHLFDMENFIRSLEIFPNTLSRFLLLSGEKSISGQILPCRELLSIREITISPLLIILSLIIFGYFIVKSILNKKKSIGRQIVFIHFVIMFLGLFLFNLFMGDWFFEWILVIFFPGFTFIVAYFLKDFLRKFKYGHFFVLAAIAIFVFINLKTLYSIHDSYGLGAKTRAVKYAVSKIGDKPFYLDSIGSCHTQGYNYLFWHYGNFPTHSYTDDIFTPAYYQKSDLPKPPLGIVMVVKPSEDGLNEFQKIYADYKQKTIESKKIGKIEVLIVNEKK
ncbi:MAG: hypothetical protein UU34_C0001G0147 [Candidatus Curtissbacteria bacterium GW2011_GWA1_41_11]|uniref:Glycosyltransferase RgtA/B/C/D-like domain-containing protein n=1 Tax=Candidatus Curtissbacteria bacterium GW2011_GWA1_41_11 TaxID=1618409 RepID=A0A0G0WUP9_9BACT|nr:MAG: hypothetical protein UU34_C0001G0147 [Candidatus Curtissbacteria bacterium GW2011_GWA1_41_11]